MKYLLVTLLSFYSATIYAAEVMMFESAANEIGSISFTLNKDKTFIIKGAFFDQDKETGAPSQNLGPPFEFKGTYSEGPNTFDLEFKTLGPGKEKAVPEQTLKELFKDSKDIVFIPSNKKVRMNKNPKGLLLYGLLMVQKSIP